MRARAEVGVRMIVDVGGESESYEGRVRREWERVRMARWMR